MGNNKDSKMMDTTLDQVYANVIVLKLAIMSLSNRLGQSDKVREDLEYMRESIVGSEDFKKEGMILLHDGLADAFDSMNNLLSKSEKKRTDQQQEQP